MRAIAGSISAFALALNACCVAVCEAIAAPEAALPGTAAAATFTPVCAADAAAASAWSFAMRAL